MFVDRDEVERRGTLVADAVVPCRCMLKVLVEDWRECICDAGGFGEG